MAYLAGIDIGTSGLKTILMTEDGNITAESYRGYPMISLKPGYAEQNPEVWWNALTDTLGEIQSKNPAEFSDISAFGLSGQMHSVVLLDRQGQVIRPCITWCDTRAKELIPQVHKLVGFETLGKITLNPLAAGFSLLSLLWVKENEPENYDDTAVFMMAKDYIRYRLTGEIGTDTTDASGTMLFDTSNLVWSDQIVSKTELRQDILPKIGMSWETAGTITKHAAATTGLVPGIPVVYGGGDQPMQALGNGIITEGVVSATIGTGGQLFTLVSEPIYDKQLRTHTFCNAVRGTWNIMGATLSAGLSLKWLNESVLKRDSFEDLTSEAEDLYPGSGGLIYLPYLTGERTPHMDPEARGVFFGLSLHHKAANLVRAVMEGVAYSLRESLDIFHELGIKTGRIIASGGGARSPLWRQILSDVFGEPVYTTNSREQACTGAAVTAGIGTGIYRNTEDACNAVVALQDDFSEPDKKNAGIYDELYQIYRMLYRNNRKLFKQITRYQS